MKMRRDSSQAKSLGTADGTKLVLSCPACTVLHFPMFLSGPSRPMMRQTHSDDLTILLSYCSSAFLHITGTLPAPSLLQAREHIAHSAFQASNRDSSFISHLSSESRPSSPPRQPPHPCHDPATGYARASACAGVVLTERDLLVRRAAGIWAQFFPRQDVEHVRLDFHYRDIAVLLLSLRQVPGRGS